MALGAKFLINPGGHRQVPDQRHRRGDGADLQEGRRPALLRRLRPPQDRRGQGSIGKSFHMI